jgi:hypothetical protein
VPRDGHLPLIVADVEIVRVPKERIAANFTLAVNWQRHG